MVILSIGILALSVLQLSSLQNTSGGHMRSQANLLAYDIIDAMRANPPAVAADAYELELDADTPQGVDCYGIEANCTTAQLAVADLNRWRTVLATYLPNGTGQVVTNGGGGGVVASATVTVQWTDPYSANDGPEQISLQAFIQ